MQSETKNLSELQKLAIKQKLIEKLHYINDVQQMSCVNGWTMSAITSPHDNKTKYEVYSKDNTLVETWTE
jgi:hypothetical protein